MAYNPAKQEEYLNSPTERASKLNDPQFENQQGYFSYDLTHQEFITPLFGQITPTMHLDTVPGDRVVVRDNTKLLLNQINGNFLSNLNQYVDSFYVPLRSVFPNNYEKLIPNPVKGEDLPNTALPVVPLLAYFRELYKTSTVISMQEADGSEDVDLFYVTDSLANGETDFASMGPGETHVVLARLALLSTIVSRGQLLDYLGLQFDTNIFDSPISDGLQVTSDLQYRIDAFFNALWRNQRYNFENNGEEYLEAYPLNLTSNSIEYVSGSSYRARTLSEFRSALSDIFEAGKFPILNVYAEDAEITDELNVAVRDLIKQYDKIFGPYGVNSDYSQLEAIDSLEDMDEEEFINIGKVLAYQQIAAQYFTNDHVDNVFSSELYMQNLRSVMYPTPEGSFGTNEPTFEMNGVRYEYDYISYGGFWSSLLSEELIEGVTNRQ